MRPGKPDGHFDSANEPLLASLRDALRPEPLSPALRDRIRAGWESHVVPAGRLRLPAIRLIGLAAAACVMVALLLPTARTRPPAAPVALSSDEAAAIVAVFGVLAWEGPVDGSLDVISASLDEMERALTQDSESSALLPWSSDDNWDVPVPNDEGASQSWTPLRSFVPRRA
jgi:hypothetical protein